MNNTNKKPIKILIFLLVLVIIQSQLYNICADGETAPKTQEEINKKIEDQNQQIIDAIKKGGIPDNTNEMEDLINTINESARSSEPFSIGKLKRGFLNIIFSVSMIIRQYAIGIYMLLIIINIVMVGFLGSKSLEKRKAYVFGSVALTVLFIIMMNVPIIYIYFQGNPMSESLTIKSISEASYNFVYFMKDNILALSTILFIYGVINLQLGKNDIPRIIAGNYYKKVAIWAFIISQALPFAVNFII